MNAAPYVRGVRKLCPLPRGEKTVSAMHACPLAISPVYSSFQTNVRGLLSGNETSCARAYKIMTPWHATHCCGQPHVPCVDPGPHNTTLHIIKSFKTPLTLPAQWAGFKARTEHSIFTQFAFCFLHFVFSTCKLSNLFFII